MSTALLIMSAEGSCPQCSPFTLDSRSINGHWATEKDISVNENQLTTLKVSETEKIQWSKLFLAV